MAATIHPDKILREMSDLWVSLSKDSSAETAAGVLRACSMTLIVVAEEGADTMQIGETLAALMTEHPSRAIVIRLDPSSDRPLGARVFAQCWRPFGQRRQICCEQIEITGPEAALADVPAVVLPLVAADLPVILWCRSARVFAVPAFTQLAALAHKLVLDSAHFKDSVDILERMAGALQHGGQVGDFSWTRLTRWREWISQTFENRAYLARLPRISHIRITHPQNAVPISAWYLGAWLTERLAKVGSKPQISLAPVSGTGFGICGLELRAEGASPLAVSMTAGPGTIAEIRVDGVTSCTALPESTDYLLMREELSITGHDPVFEAVLPAALALAKQGAR